MKYMIMMFGGVGASLRDRSPEWIGGINALLLSLDAELRQSGELVDGQKLVDPTAANTVRIVDSKALPTDGPFAEVKESLAGYWIVEATEERALEIAASVVQYIEFPMEVRQIMDQPPAM
ncbi:MAG: YciI family protein [Jiangellaceae bacterium]